MAFILRLVLVVTDGFFKKSLTSVVCCCCEWFREFVAAFQLMASGGRHPFAYNKCMNIFNEDQTLRPYSFLVKCLQPTQFLVYSLTVLITSMFGDAEPPVSLIFLLVSSLLVLTVGLGEQHHIVQSIKAVVFLNNGVGIFDIGEGNDMPARKSMDEKMTVPCITFWTDSLSVLWYTNLLPFHEDILSAILVFSTSLRICYMALNSHQLIVIRNSVEELDQPFNSNHQLMLWLGKQKRISVLHLSYEIVITLLPNGIQTEKHVSLYESDSFSLLTFLHLNLEDKVRIQEGGIVMNGPGPVWANQLNTELRDYVWDPS